MEVLLDALLFAVVGVLGWWLHGVWGDVRPMTDAEVDELSRRADVERAVARWEDETLKRVTRLPADLHEKLFSRQELEAAERAARRLRLSEEAAAAARKEAK